MQTLSAEEIGKSYRGRRVVSEVSFHVKQGEVIGLLGPNGAGKTTIFYIIVGLIPAETGRVLINGQDITHEPMYLRARNYGIGYLPQEPSIFRKLMSRTISWRYWRRNRFRGTSAGSGWRS
jgi:lipopolysaccharide export system ATP-binding protein